MTGSGCTNCSKSISNVETKWLDSLSIRNRSVVIKVDNCFVRADGFDPNTNTVYEFYGDYWHGNPEIYDRSNVNSHNKKTFGELYDKTIKREVLLINNGFNIVSIWENDFRKKGKV